MNGIDGLGRRDGARVRRGGRGYPGTGIRGQLKRDNASVPQRKESDYPDTRPFTKG